MEELIQLHSMVSEQYAGARKALRVFLSEHIEHGVRALTDIGEANIAEQQAILAGHGEGFTSSKVRNLRRRQQEILNRIAEGCKESIDYVYALQGGRFIVFLKYLHVTPLTADPIHTASNIVTASSRLLNDLMREQTAAIPSSHSNVVLFPKGAGK